MKLALALYLVPYVILTFLTIRDDRRNNDPLWEQLSDATLLPLGLVGILLFMTDYSNAHLRFVWKAVAPVIIVGQFLTCLIGRHRILGQSTTFDLEGVRFADFATLVMLAPMFLINIAYAFNELG